LLVAPTEVISEALLPDVAFSRPSMGAMRPRQQFGAPEEGRTVEVFGYGVAQAFGDPALAS